MIKDDDATSESSDPRDVLKDPRAILAGLPPLPALEAFNRQTRDFLNSPQALLANLKQFGNGPTSGPLIPPSLPPSSLGPLPPLPRPPSQPTTPNSQRSSPVGGAGGGSNQGNWSFEEQFKQVDNLFIFIRKLIVYRGMIIFAKNRTEFISCFNIEYWTKNFYVE